MIRSRKTGLEAFLHSRLVGGCLLLDDKGNTS
jgi:hypothetical protein